MLIYLQMLDTPEERAKFEKLYYSHRRTMLHIAMKILKDHQLAEDAVQEAFLRLVKNFSKIGQVNCPRTRLFTVIIVRNISLTMLAERKKENVLERPEAVIPIEYDLEEDVLERIAYEEVLRARLKSLDKREGKADNKGKQAGDEGECVNIQAISAGKSMRRYERI